MIMKKIVCLFLVVAFFSGCQTTNLINGEKKQVIHTDCGRVQIKSKWLQSVGIKIQVKPLDGDLAINADSAILKHPMPGTNIETRVYHNNKKVNGQFLLKKKDVLLYRIYVSLPLDFDENYYTEYNKTYIAPNDFILCDDKPVITDTIRINTPWMHK